MMKRIAALIVLSILLVACNMPDRALPQATATADVVATEVARMQTELPTATQPPTPAPPQPTNTLQSSPPTETPSPSPTTAPESTATTIPGDPAAALGAPGWKDSLDTTKNFYLYDNDNTAVEAGDGSLRLVGKTNIGWHGWSLTYAQNAANFYLEGTFKTGSCSGADLYGLVFRASKENAGYFFGVTCDGRYNFHARDFNNNTDTEILSMKSNSAIIAGSGQTNRIGVKTEGTKISLYANGVLMEELTSDTYASGYFGAFIAGFETPGFTVDLDQIALWKLN
jgi:hypothetical protein